ncbi:hypothetical protein A1F99_121140 [Pyrenophora tritici-repentis]|nr:hypothetical protein A1F99_121140 [Pyrenophora tritici-repentis]
MSSPGGRVELFGSPLIFCKSTFQSTEKSRCLRSKTRKVLRLDNPGK